MHGKLKRGVQSVVEAAANLLPEWDYVKNSKLPDETASRSTDRVWWVCARQHSWQASVANRTKRGDGCPTCSGRLAELGVNDLKTVMPELADSWHPTLNGDVYPTSLKTGSSFDAWWLCPNGHEFQCRVSSRAKGVGCDTCRKILKVETLRQRLSSRGQIHTLVSQLDPVLNSSSDIDNVFENTEIKYWWVCGNDHTFQSTWPDRVETTGIKQCPVCKSKNAAWLKLDPERQAVLASEFDTAKNSYVNIADTKPAKKYWWLCSNGHSYNAQFRSRVVGSNCGICANQRVLSGFNDMATTHPELASQFDRDRNGVGPEEVIAGTGKPFWWICNKGHSVQATGDKRKNHGCGVCSNKSVLKGYNDLATTHPHLAAEFDLERNVGMSPETIVAGHTKKLFWICYLGHSYQTTGSHRVSQNAGCPYCARKSVLPGFNDMATLAPQLLEHFNWDRNSPDTPSTLSPRTNRPLWWQCEKGHEYRAKAGNRLQIGGLGCPVCSTHQVLKGFNDLSTTEPDLAAEWDLIKNTKLNLYEVAAGTNKKAWWLCSEGHSWYAYIGLRSRGRGCPTCSKGGFNNSKPGWIYLIENNQLNSRKFGISNHRTKRLMEYEAGWKTLAIWRSDNGHLIRDLETAILKHIRKNLGLPTHLGPEDMGRAGGYSETFSMDGPSNLTLIESVWKIYEELKTPQDQLVQDF